MQPEQTKKMANSNCMKLEKTANLLREAIPRMSKLKIPLTPENYHVWYKYTMGSNLELNKAIDQLLENGTKFTSKVNYELHKTYVFQPPEKLLNSSQQDLQKLVTRLFEKINGMSKKTQIFSSTLENYNDVLQADPDIDTVTDLITSLIDATDSALKSNQEMESMLESINEEVDTLRGNLQTLNVEAFTDKLTAIPNRRAFDQRIEELFDNYHEDGQIFSLLLIDIDHFKLFNDTYGHAAGDRVLKYVASVMTGDIKGNDLLARYGGEEFAVLLPSTYYDGAISVGSILREKISSIKLVDSNDHEKSLGYVTVSIGVATITRHDDADSIVERADKALYLAKENGRNKVMGEQDL
jgi:diguanylate cyclase